jgi:branched-chain amino acid transport system permease protein
MGYGAMVSFGHAAFFGLGGYAVGIAGLRILAQGRRPLFGWSRQQSPRWWCGP